MKRRFIFILAFLFYSTINGIAAYFEFLPYTITQPDGTVINCFVSGDEFFNWIHDKDGYTIIQAPDGYYYYGEQDGDLVKPSKYRVNSIIPSNKGIGTWIKISLKEYQRRKESMFSYRNVGKGLPENAPQTGTLNNIVVYIRFSDDTEFSAQRQAFDDKFNLSSGVSLRSYYMEVSYSNLTISSTHYPPCPMTTNLSYQDSHPRAYFQPYNATTNPTGYNTDTEKTSREHTLLASAINWINQNYPVPSSLNIDGDNDGMVDNVCFIIRGSNGAWNDLLWAHRWSLYSKTVNINGKRVYSYTFQPESQVAVRTLCHEMFHSLGAPDLYHYTNQGAIAPAGSWDLMDSGGGHMLTYMKWKYSGKKWISDLPVVDGTGTYTLNPVSSPVNNCYKILSPFSADQYFVVEYRYRSGTYESNVPGSGLIVYRIDSRYTGNSDGPPDEVYVYRPGGTTTTNGSPGTAFFSLTAGRTSINDATDPKSFLQDGSAGGLNISNVTTGGSTISFTITLPDPPAAPTALKISDILQTSFTAKWNSAANATGYKVDLATDPGFTSFVNGYNNKDLGNVLSTGINGLTAKTQYYCRVKAYNSGGSGLSSATVTLRTLSVPSSVPVNPTASSCNDLVMLNWRKSTGADFTMYRIYFSTTASGTISRLDSALNGISDTSKVISGLTRGQTFYFQVTSVNNDGSESGFSAQSSAKVKTGIIPKIKSKWGNVLLCYNLGDSIKNFQWYYEGNAIPGETSQFYKINNNWGNYSIRTTDLNGCKNSSLPLTMNGLNSIVAYPNPASVSFAIKMKNESSGRAVITIYNSLGTRVLEMVAEKRDIDFLQEIPVVGWPIGIYQVRVSVNDEMYSTQIIIAR
jgi:M6 family metalloprotease-like protein